MRNIIIIVFIAITVYSCSNGNGKADAYGNFESVETIISAESSGKIIKIDFKQGQRLKKGDIVCIIDTTAATLKKRQILAKKQAVSSKFSHIIAQVNVLEEQKVVLMKEINRVKNLLKDSAATQKQLDDLNGKLQVMNKQIAQVKTQNQSIFDELKVYDTQIDIVNEQISTAIVHNQINGTVLVKYAELYELVMPGKALYKIADLSELDLRAYISGTQLDDIKIGKKVKVFIDKTKDEQSMLEGKIIWVSGKAEFTPKTIQTKEERVNLVYAIKIRVKNDGSLKIGMPAEVMF